MKYLFTLFLFLVITSCNRESFELTNEADDFFFLRHDGADMPVWVEGNTASKVFILMLHGGPGGSAFIINGLVTDFTSPLEQNYGLVYWEQRGSGTAQGSFNADQLNPDQFVEDLERLVLLLKGKYGQDIKLFLSGISWGGYLGTSYLAKENNQDLIQGWINIVGPHDFKQIGNIGRRRLLKRSIEQIALEKNVEAWQEVKDFCESRDTINSKSDFLEINRYANRAELWMRDSLSTFNDEIPVSEQLSFVFNSPFSSDAWLSNRRGIFNSEMIDIIFERDLSSQMSNINIPSLFITGKFDFVVPSENLQEQYELISSESKSIHVLPKSGHGITNHELDILLDLMIDFVEAHR